MSETVGSRLREERERLELSQEALGAVGGVTKLSQFNYETDKRVPDAMYLAAVAKIGTDVYYVVTGQRMSVVLADEERVLVNYYRTAHEPIKKAAMGVLLSAQPTGSAHNIGGDMNVQNNNASGNVQNNYGRKRTKE